VNVTNALVHKQWENVTLRAGTLLVYLYLYAPIFILILFSFNRSRLSAVWQGFTWQWYQAAWNNATVVDALRTSLLVAFLTTLISTVIGTMAALVLTRYRFRLRQAFESLFYLPIIIPEIVVGFATVVFLGLIGFTLGLTTIVIAHVAFSLSYVVMVVRARLSGIDRTLEEAAMDLGANELETFFKVTLPLLAPSILASALLVFTLSLDDYVITSFVAGGGATTLPLKIYSMVKTGVTPEINAVSTILLVVTIILVFLSQRFQQERPSRGAVTATIVVFVAIGVFAVGGGRSAADRPQLNLFIWSEYIPDSVVKEFERRYDVQVNIELYDSNEALLAKLQTGVAQYDLIVPSDYMMDIMIKEGLLQRIDRSRLTNFGNLDPQFLARPFDPNNDYSVPYLWGTTGIGYRKDKVTEPVDSWAVMWEAHYQDRISMLDDVREVFAAALKLRGHSLNTTDPTLIAEARRLLIEQKPLVKTYDSGAFDVLLLSGDAWIAHSYNGQVVKAAMEEPNIAFVLPREGGTVFMDSLAIPKTAPHVDLAHVFINYILEAPVAAEISNRMIYSTPNLAARPLIRPELVNNPALYPPADVLKRCEFIRDVGPAISLYDRAWTEIKSR
jgi:spermidine/putrescine transport system permease protein